MTTTKIAAALLAAQREFKDPVKDSINPHFKSKYASLHSVMTSVRETLNKHGIVLSQGLDYVDGHDVLVTSLIHSEDGSTVTSEMRLHLEKNTPQGMGSAITYGRRFSLTALCGIVADDDDDAEEASKPQRTPGRPMASVVSVLPERKVTEEEKWVAEQAVLEIARASDIVNLQRVGEFIRACEFKGEDHKQVTAAYLLRKEALLNQ